MQSHSGRSIGNVDLLFTDFNCCLCRGAACPKAWENRRNDSMGQVKNNDSFLGKAEKLKPVLKHRMLRPVGVVSFERKKADSGADFWNTVGIERLGILSVMLSDEPLAYRGIVIPLLGSYWGGSQGLSSTYEQAHVDLDLLTLASFILHRTAHSMRRSLLSVYHRSRPCPGTPCCTGTLRHLTLIRSLRSGSRTVP